MPVALPAATIPPLMKSILAVCVLALLTSCSKQVNAESGNPAGPAANAVKAEGGCCAEGGSCCADKAAAKEAAPKSECCGACAPEVQAAPKAAGQ